MALDRILAYQQGANYKRDDRLTRSQSTMRGMSLPQVLQLGNALGMKLRMAKREAHAEVMLPSVIHWKSGHFSFEKRADGFSSSTPYCRSTKLNCSAI